MTDPDFPPPTAGLSSPPSGGTALSRLLLLVFPLAALLLLWDVLLGGRVLLPAEFLKGMSPWNTGLSEQARQALPQWNVLQWDGMAEFYPWREYLARSMASGHIPLWNPYVYSGTPFLANSQSAPLYPLHVFYWLPLGLSTAARMGWLDFLHLSLAGLFTCLLAQDLGLRRGAAVVAGLAFELSGFAVAWLELPSFITVACWIPLLLLCLGRAVRLNCWRGAAGAAAAAGMMLLAGHVQVGFYGLLAAGLTWLWETATLARSVGTGRALRTALPIGLFVGGVALALTAPQLLPSVELSRMSHRAGGPSAAGYQGYLSLAMPWQNWVTLLVPDYYGLPGRGDFWGGATSGPAEVMEYAGHIGSGAFGLAVLGLVFGRKVTGRTGLVALLALVSLLLAVGSPLCALLYFGVPGFSQSGSPARVLVLFCLAQALLAGLGLEYLLRTAAERWSRAAILAAAAAGTVALMVVGLHGLALNALQNLSVPPGVLNDVAVPALGRAVAYAAVTGLLLALVAWLFRENAAHVRTGALAGVAGVVVTGGLLMLAAPYNPTSAPEMAYPPSPVTDFLRTSPTRVATLNSKWSLTRIPPALLPPNCSMTYGWRDAQGYDSLALGHYRPLARAFAPAGEDSSPNENGNMVFIKGTESPLFHLLGARHVVSQTPISQPGFMPAGGLSAGPPFVYEDTQALPEAFLTSSWFTEEEGAALERLRSQAAAGHLGTVAVAAGSSVPFSPSSSTTPPLAQTTERVSAQRIRVGANPSAPSLLVLLEGYTPGWKAYVQPAGGPARVERVLRVNTAFQGIPLAAGPASVEWRYEPASFRVGLFLGLAALALLLGTSALRGTPSRSPLG